MGPHGTGVTGWGGRATLLDSAGVGPPGSGPDCTNPGDLLEMTDDRERWALILGASSGMGEATAVTLAKAGYKILGVHLDFRAALAHVEEVKAAIQAVG